MCFFRYLHSSSTVRYKSLQKLLQSSDYLTDARYIVKRSSFMVRLYAQHKGFLFYFMLVNDMSCRN